jgi:hypothetical protein
VVDQEVLETDADAFDCTTCPLAAQQAALYRENVDAWHIFHTVGRRVVVQLGMGPEVFRQCVKDREPDEIVDLLDRLSLIHDVLDPPKAGQG